MVIVKIVRKLIKGEERTSCVQEKDNMGVTILKGNKTCIHDGEICSGHCAVYCAEEKLPVLFQVK